MIPGFSALSADSSNLIKSLMSGQLTGGERRAIYDAGAERGVSGGMPGSSGMAGSLFANADLRNIGLKSGERQQQGFQDLLAMLQGYAGTVAPTAGEELVDSRERNRLSYAQQMDAYDRRKREEQEDEEQRRWDFTQGIGRPYSSERSGETFDRTGKPTGYQKRYDFGAQGRRFGVGGF